MHRELTNKWKPVDIKYSKMKMIISVLIYTTKVISYIM